MSIASTPIPKSSIAAVAVVLALFVALPASVDASSGMDEGYQLDASMKEEWQSEYRRLLQDSERLKRNAEAARRNYSQAQQRNYPRGSVRQQYLIDEEEAKKELAEVDAALEQFKADGRRDGALPGWFYEVEEESLASPEPAAIGEDDAEDMEGRNPLYLDSE
jgi:hypothetical protein